MKRKGVIIIVLIVTFSILTLLYFFKGNKYTINDITNYLKKYNTEFNIKDIKEQKIHMDNTNKDLVLFECSPKNDSSIKFYIYETYPPMVMPFTKKHLSDSYKEEVNSYLNDKYVKIIIIENPAFNTDSIDNAIKEIDSIRDQIYYEKYNNFGITPSSNDNLDYICLTIDYSSNEKIVCFQYGEETSDVLMSKLNIQKR